MRDGVGAAVEPLGGELGHLEEQRKARLSLGGVRLPLEEREERRPGAPLGVELFQLGDRLFVAGRRREQRLVGLGGVLHVAELLEPSPRDRPEKLRLFFARRQVRGQRRLLLEKIAVAAQGLVHPHELAQRGHVVGIELHDLREHGHERGVALDAIAIDAGDLAQHLETHRFVFALGSLEILPQKLDERVPALGLQVEPLQRFARFLIGRVVAEDRLVLIDRFLRVGARLGQPRDLRGERRLFRTVGERALRVGQDGEQACSILGRKFAEEGEHAGVRGLEPPEPVEIGLGELGLVAHPPVDHGDLEDDPRFFALLGAAAKLIFVERHQVIPLLSAREVLGEKAHGFGVAGPEVEHALVSGDGLLFLIELAKKDAPETVQDERALLFGRRIGGPDFEQERYLFPIFVERPHVLEQVGGADVLGIELERHAEPLGDGGERVPLARPVAVGHLPRARDERALEGGVGRLLRFFQVMGDQLLPLLALVLGALDRFFGRRVAWAQLEQALVGCGGPAVVEELVLEHARQLELHRKFDRSAGVEPCLEAEQLGDGLPLAPHLVPAPRRLEEHAKLGFTAGALGCSYRVGQLVPRAFIVRIILKLAKCRSDLLRAHRHPRKPVRKVERLRERMS